MRYLIPILPLVALLVTAFGPVVLGPYFLLLIPCGMIAAGYILTA